ncbi:MAG: hypothetical protein LUE09_00540 [Synergistaceae bacterium]|nr:hypothetical protein [Synergistaceae bacterium]
MTTTPGRTPAEPPVGAAQTMPCPLFTCIAAIARAAARVWMPPSASLPAASAAIISPAVGESSDIGGESLESPSSTARSITARRRSIS